MNKEQLRLKLIEAWAKGYVELNDSEGWGFCVQIKDPHFERFLGITERVFVSSYKFDAIAREIALEIANFPLNQALK